MGESYLSFADFDLEGKTILLRVDINCPLDPFSGRFLDVTRIEQILPTLDELSHSRVVMLAHQSRPGKGDYTGLELHARTLSEKAGKKIEYVDSILSRSTAERISAMQDGEVILLENTRFLAEEIVLKNRSWEEYAQTHLVKHLSKVADFFVHDAFAAAHRAQPSLVGFTHTLPCIAGPLMNRELEMLGQVLAKPRRPLIAVLGGMKVDDSVRVADNMLRNGIADRILTAGLVANLFMYETGIQLGKSNEEFLIKEVPDFPMISYMAKQLMEDFGDKIALPTDVVLNQDGKGMRISMNELPSEYPIYDLGIDTTIRYSDEIRRAGSVVLNGPAGVFELEQFSFGTMELMRAMATTEAFTVLGGGHTATLVKQLGMAPAVDHLSTGGGACLDMLSGKQLPAIDCLTTSKMLYEQGHYE